MEVKLTKIEVKKRSFNEWRNYIEMEVIKSKIRNNNLKNRICQHY